MDCVAGFVSIPGCWIVWIVLLGCVDSGCVNLVAGFVFLVFCRWVVWILVWVGGYGSVAVWVKK